MLDLTACGLRYLQNRVTHAMTVIFVCGQFLKSQLSVLNDWTVEQDTFNDSTPLGIRNFANIVATLDPNATKRVVLAAHYDSKHMLNPNDEFVGATDSAVPCAMLLDIAYSLQTLFRQRQTVRFLLHYC